MFKNYEIREIKIDSPEYPALLTKSKYAAPLWIVGKANFSDEFCLAMVGTRSPSGLAASSVKSIVKALKNYNVRIISGLAQGIDSLCHAAAIENSLPTTAVIAQGLDVPLQSSQMIMAEKILELGGNIITPFAPKTRAYLSSFVKRNTIISGISNATLIVESRLKGGAMHTANFCIRENKPLFAMPGSPMNPTSEGCNFLIYQKQAQIIWNASKLPEILGLNSLFPLAPYSTSCVHSKTELPNWVTEGTILQINEICEQSEKNVNEVLATLTELEMLGKCKVNGQHVIFF
jgi:DNA processing protein